jgi:Serpin (serine protease inhibitor)
MNGGAVGVARASERVARLVDAYARRVYPAVLEQHPGASASSPLGVWLLLAACASGATGEALTGLEKALGCSAEEASRALAAVVASPPPALKAAIAVWVAAADASDKLAAWVRGLPPGVESGFMPTKSEADAWADKHTLGLIKSFPLHIDAATRIVLASALATKVSWRIPFEVVPAVEHLGETSPWRGAVKRLLWDARPGGKAMIVRTHAAGAVAVHHAIAEEDLTVVSVSADPGTSRRAVLEAAHEVAAFARGDSPPASACSLFDLPLGRGHSWQITERVVQTPQAGERVERIAGVSMPAWRAESTLDLRASPLFGSAPALETMRELIGPLPDDDNEAVQAATASFTRYGFEAAAVTAFAVRTSAMRVPRETGLERTAILRFDHPYAAIAIAGQPPPPAGRGQPGRSSSASSSPWGSASGSAAGGQTAEPQSPFGGMPLFTVWVQDPEEAEGDPPAPAGRGIV